ncbi:hypothetical protein BTHERMOSOX_204 [Bathymodiolus thermophilus thioautotrophic gill symbiont]|nr:hypothetical protein BTHERMOSOX_204 [Bathymodiolus thermophilus thioautotrophic gill symbiont]
MVTLFPRILSVSNTVPSPLSLMTISPVPLAMASLNVATRSLLDAICPVVFVVIVGATVSTVIAKTAEASLVLPAVSVAFAVILCVVSALKSTSLEKLPPLSAVTVPNEVAPLNNSTVAFASAVPERVKALVWLVILSSLLPVLLLSAKLKPVGTLGFVVSIVTVPVEAVEILPAISTV